MSRPDDALADDIATTLSLGAGLELLARRHGAYDLRAHWKQGEFHHDVVVAVGDPTFFLVIATNCNGGIKEVLRFDEEPDRWALWHWRCPDNDEFDGALPHIRHRALTPHWFDPCELLTPSARSEMRPEHRARQRGGGWIPRE